MEPSYSQKYAGMHPPAKTLPAPAPPSCVPPVPMPTPIGGPVGHHPCPKPVFTQPAAMPACPPAPAVKAKGTMAGTILVLFILLVIVSRYFPSLYGEAKICKK